MTGYDYKKRVRQINEWAKNGYNMGIINDITKLQEVAIRMSRYYVPCGFSSIEEALEFACDDDWKESEESV